jgi:CubicO group peptidase (beta-lactamase class C family)
MRDEVFKPLQMNRTSVHVAPEQAAYVVQNYDAAGAPSPWSTTTTAHRPCAQASRPDPLRPVSPEEPRARPKPILGPASWISFTGRPP